ncbi:MAG: DUF2970 domain-containing protein [Pseudomonadales bacterium]|nr:DUF2970 domain-containing protein [Pseudomonadales bacterium]MBO6565248.1 DUF2970 domain-containing protein [Pseudomonadales bacterium]MBO6595069.1 DUF2970 domain-containing protein [Pseudomonadales bacterium]MBO6659062.1 DUF2970 domain-containing protein [Pseudomonadales bacterium]MBO6701574.1 DUF2970 domain-containing protein [Pseudomonadales bacterium]
MSDLNRQKDDQQSETPEVLGEPSLLEVVMSVLAAALGVQNAKNRERDFTRGNPLVFIAAGLIFTVLFVLSLVGVVYLVL